MLGPLVRYREDEVYRRLEVFPNVVYTARHSPAAEKSWWFVFFPVLFLGNDDFLVFPLGGVSHGLLGLHELLMVTPLYVRTRTRSGPPGDERVYTVRHVLWPLIAWGSDGRPDGRRKLRIAPFYGRRTGPHGERSGFLLWPFYTWRRNGEERAFFYFPFYGRTESPVKRETTVMFPFYHRVENHLTGATDTALWPFWRRAGGSDELEVRRLWPIAAYRRARWNTSEFVAWPLWRRTYVDDRDEWARWTWVTPLFRQKTAVSKRDGRRSRKTVVWPVGRWETARDGTREVAIPVLSPVDAPALREFSEPFRPLISVYHRRSRPDGTREVSALFGLYMARRTPERRKVRLLGGLIGWDKGPEGRFLRLLWGIRLRTGQAKSR